jgi:hypothetical protein
MAYAGITAAGFRNQSGTLSEKIAVQAAAIKAETDSIDSTLAAGLKVAKITLAGGNANAFSFAWQNPESSKIIIIKAVLSITTQTALAATMDIGPAADATTSGDTLFDGVALNGTPGLFDNITNKGTNGLPQVSVDENGGTTDYVNGRILGANGPDLVGRVYLFYTKV